MARENCDTGDGSSRDLAALAATVEELKLAQRSRSSKFDPARHTLCKKCDGKGVANAGERPGEHLSYKCPGKP